MILQKPRREAERRTGAANRDAVLADLETGRALYLLRGRRALLTRLLSDGTATADDVYAAVKLPDDVDPRCLGGVPTLLAKAGIIRAAGYVTSKRPERNASPIHRWELANRAAAERWLAEHADEPDPPTNEKARQLALPGLG